MSDILSQSEIDALLSALSSGDDNVVLNNDVEEKKVRTYNFARPSKFGKEQLRTLEVMFESFSRLASSFLTGYLRTATQIEVANAEQVTYNEFSNSLLNPVVLGIIDLGSPILKGSVILDVSSNIGYAIIDRILGGSGDTLKKTREFTEIEKILLSRILSQIVSYLVEPWENVCHISPSLEKLETNSQFAQIISPNEMIALVSLSIKLGEVEGLINFCIPHLVIEPIMDKLNTKHWFSSQEDEDLSVYRSKVEVGLEETKIPVSVVVGRTNITVDEFIDLQVGDVITLDSFVNSDFSVMIGNLLKFYAKPGISRGKNAVQITSLVGKEE
ncbi:MAG: flagellar motor switch protein FliM [Clostridiales bacterium]|nr:flagellar motor switch protein FliM [Clostridiales bacterium]